MRASLCIEAVGHGEAQRMRLYRGIMREAGFGRAAKTLFQDWQNRWGVWDAETDREVYGRTDYSQANSKGSRGVRIWYTLESGRRYRVRAPQSWKSTDEYYCHVTEAGDIVRE
jgi:hypothetical protein